MGEGLSVTLILRTWLGFAVFGSAVAFGYRGHWAMAAALIDLLVIRRGLCCITGFRARKFSGSGGRL
jgi:hypothetical protein